MSSHREAPEISKDPVADSTDLYAFVSPDRPDTVTIIANYLPLESPAGGPNFYEFGDDVLYTINIDTSGNAVADITYRFNFRTEVRNPNTFLYNTGQIRKLDDESWNRRQFYSVTKVVDGQETVLARHLACPPCNIGPRSTPDYASLARDAIHPLPNGEGMVFAGQRREGFYVDLGSIFDLGALRPVQNFHLIRMDATMGVDATNDLNVHTIALQIPIELLSDDESLIQARRTRRGLASRTAASRGRASNARQAHRSNGGSTSGVIGVWTAAYRRKARVRDQENDTATGPFVQVSRLGNPLFNEVIVPMVRKDRWNALPPNRDNEFMQYVQDPELAKLLPVLYPGVFPNLAAYSKSRADLVAILLTGIPAGIVPGFDGNFTGEKPADLLRLNMAIEPSSNPNILGLLGGDVAGFPNGRRVFDDTVTIEVRAVAGATLPLVDPAFKPDGAVPLLTQGVTPDPKNDRYLNEFPYLGVPRDGFHTPAN